MNEDFKSLVIRLQNNDSLAQKELYELFSVPMFNLCLRYIKNRQDAEEVLQNSFIKVYENIHKINNPEALPSWIKRIFIHTSIDAVRKQRIFYPIEFINNHASNSFADTKLNCFELVGLIEIGRAHV